eukprot:9490752-Pyramimonas_sp.AAC.1
MIYRSGFSTDCESRWTSWRMLESGRIGVGCHVYCMSPPRCRTPRVVESVGSPIRGTAVGRTCPDWRSVGD